MRVLILTYGSRGDVQPCLSLCKALQKAGHTPLLAMPAELRQMADENEVEALPLPGNMAAISSALNEAGQSPVGVTQAMLKNLRPVAEEVVRIMLKACNQADVMVHTYLFTIGAHAIACQMGMPNLSAQFFPFYINTADFPSLAFPTWRLGPVYNHLTHSIALAGFQGVQKLLYPGMRKQVPELPPHLHWPFTTRDHHEPSPLLFSFSPALFPAEIDWGTPVTLTGWWFLDHPSYTPGDDLLEYLEAGAPPVCVGFGSMLNPRAPRMRQALLEGLRRAGQRALILTGWDGWADSERAPDRFFIPYVPHEWIYPRCAALIHHGGSGTTGAALRSGRPSIVLPLAADQPFWAARVHAYGAGPQPLDQHRLDAEQVERAVREAVESEEIQRGAARLGEIVRAEPGASRAVEIIESIAK